MRLRELRAVCCIKGFDARSFSFNTRAAEDGYEQQFATLRRVLELGLDTYGYVTLTSPHDEGGRERRSTTALGADRRAGVPGSAAPGASFSDLMLRLPAIYPTEVVAALDRLATVGLLQRRSAKGCADAVLLDPPWYMDFIRPMLAAAAAACRSGGGVLLSVPPAVTRPSAEADRAATINFALRLGLELIGDEPLGLFYETSFFETNALAAAALHPPARWRRGDLLVFRKTRPATRPAPATSRRRGWIEVPVGRMRLFIKGVAADTGGSHGLIPIVSGDVLASVSRRDPRRRTAAVWTSGNRIFRTDNPRLVLEAALSHSSAGKGAGAQPVLCGSVLEREASERVGELIGRLAEREADEERGAVADPEWSEPWTLPTGTFLGRSPATIFG